jgi:exopolysaccharide biosynthesis protein
MIATTVAGDLLFITIDGRPKGRTGVGELCYANGMTWEGQVSFLEQLGCQDESLAVQHAANMDGGGSTTIYLHDGERGEIRNQPTDPGRAIGNTLIIFDHSLLDRETRVITAEHREQIMKGHAKHLAGFDEARRLARGEG